MKFPLAWHRLWAIVLKEFVQMRRDRITFAMMVGIPVMQLVLFGFAINTDPKRLPTVVFDASPSAYTRSFVASLENSGYFDVLTPPATVVDAREAMAVGDIQFIVSIPPDFSRLLVRGDKPVVLLEADASDPSATGNAISALNSLNQSALQHDLKGPLARLGGTLPSRAKGPLRSCCRALWLRLFRAEIALPVAAGSEASASSSTTGFSPRTSSREKSGGMETMNWMSPTAMASRASATVAGGVSTSK